MTVTQPEIEKLKEDFKNITKKDAGEHPADFYAYLHLVQSERIEKLFQYKQTGDNVEHETTWAEMKTYMDQEV